MTGNLIANLRELAKKFPDNVLGAVYVVGQRIMTVSKRRCPVAPDGGTLRATGTVGRPVRRGRAITILLSYGGGVADAYAIAVHEHLSEYSPPSWVIAESSGRGIVWSSDGTGPKFLEGPINEAAPRVMADIAEIVKLNGKVPSEPDEDTEA